jgi:hypothetical protein
METKTDDWRRPLDSSAMNRTETQERANESRELPVDWDRLKQIQDEHPTPKVSGVLVVGIGLLGLSVFSFFLAFYLALDPTEWIEPAQYIFLTTVGLGMLTGGAGLLFVLRAARGSDK